jgi:hypothetical protein
LAGCAFTQATNSWTLLAGTFAFTISTCGPAVSAPTGARSFTGSYGTFPAAGTMAITDVLAHSSV